MCVREKEDERETDRAETGTQAVLETSGRAFTEEHL